MRDRVAGVLQVAEIRAVAADDLWLSPATGRDSVAFHVTWVADETSVLPMVALLDDLLAPLHAPAALGRISTAGPERLAALYPRLGDF